MSIKPRLFNKTALQDHLDLSNLEANPVSPKDYGQVDTKGSYEFNVSDISSPSDYIQVDIKKEWDDFLKVINH